jgi:hypothetical protein
MIRKHQLDFFPAEQTTPDKPRHINRCRLYARIKGGSLRLFDQVRYGAIHSSWCGEATSPAECALRGEAEACIAAIEATAELGIFRAMFESDSSTLVAAIKNGAYDLADTGALMREARSLRILHFDSADFVFCRRNCNNAAHCLAKYGYQDNAPSSRWSDVAPDFVLGLVASDLAVQQV